MRSLLRPGEEIPPAFQAAAFALVLLIGGAMRIVPALETPVFVWDDAVVHLEATYLEDFLRSTVEGVGAKLEEGRTGENSFRVAEAVQRFHDQAQGVPLQFGRPLHDGLVLASLSMLRVVAPERVTAATALTSAIAGTLTLPVFFLLGHRLYGPRGAWIAFLVLAVSAAHVRYSRIGFSEALLVLVLGGVLLALERSRRHVDRPGREAFVGTFTVGLLAGLGMLVHFRFSVLVAILLACELALGLRRDDGPRRRPSLGLGRAGRMAAGATLPLALAELPYYLLLLAGRLRGIDFEVKTYLEQVVLVLAPQGLGYAGSLVRFRPDNLATYPFAFLALGGVVLFAGTAVGIGWILRDHLPRRKPSLLPQRPAPLDRTLVALFLGPILLYSFTVPLLRYGATSFALATLLLARVGARIADRRERSAVPLAGILVAVAVLEGLVLSSLMVETRSGWAESLEALETEASRGAPLTERTEEQLRGVLEGDGPGEHRSMGTDLQDVPRHLSTMPPISWALAGRDVAETVPPTAAELSGRVRAGHRYLLVDSLVDFMAMGDLGFPDRQALIRKVEERCPTVAEVDNPAGATLFHDLELNYRPLFDTLALSRTSVRREADVIRVYDLVRCRDWRWP